MSNESRIAVQNEGDILILEIQEPRISEGLVMEALSSELEVILQDSKCKKVLLDLHQGTGGTDDQALQPGETFSEEHSLAMPENSNISLNFCIKLMLP